MIFSLRFVRQYPSNGIAKHMHLSADTSNSIDFLWCPEVMGTSIQVESFVDMTIEWDIYGFACLDPTRLEA